MTTTKQINIQRAQRTARLIAGTVLSLEPGVRGSWDLSILCNNGRYDISVWDDNTAQHNYALGLCPGDVVSLQVHAYEHPQYNPWKVYDYLTFTPSTRALCISLERKLQEQMQVIKVRQTEYDLTIKHLTNQRKLLDQRRAQSQTYDFWRHLGGIVGGISAIVAAPATGGASLLALPSCGILLCPSGADLQQQMGEENLDFSLAIADNNLGITRSMARTALDIVDQLETVITSAKHFPWKNASNGNSYGLLPASIRSDLVSTANGSGTVIDVKASQAQDLKTLATAVAAMSFSQMISGAHLCNQKFDTVPVA